MTGAASEKLKVFVSYAREDLAFADQLVAALDAAGFDPLIDRHRMTGGEEFQSRLAALILECDTMAFVVTPASVEPGSFCNWEIEEAMRLSKRLIPVVCKPLGKTPVPPQLKSRDYIFFYDEPDFPGSGFGFGLQRLVTALNSDLDWLREHTRLLGLAKTWDAGGRPLNRLLSGTDITDAKAWVARQPKTAPDPAPVQFDYLKASEEAEAARNDAARRQLEEREKLLRDSEAAAAEREAAVRRAEQEQKEKLRSQRRASHLTWLAAVLSLVMLAGATWQQRSTSVREARLAATEAAAAFGDGDYGRATRNALAGLPPPGALPTEYWSPVLENEIRRSRYLDPELAVLQGHVDAVQSVVTSEDGKYLASVAGHDEPGLLWNAATGTLIARLWDENGPDSQSDSARFLREGRRCLTWSISSGFLWLWDSATGKLVAKLYGPGKDVRSVETINDGKFIAVAYDDSRDTYIFEGGTGKLHTKLEGMKGIISDIVPVGNSERIITHSMDDATVMLWDVPSARRIATWTDPSGKSPDVNVSDNGATVVTFESSADIVRAWSGENGEAKGEISHAGKAITGFAISTDGSWVASRATGKSTAQLLDTRTGEVRELAGHRNPVVGLSFSADGSRLISRAEKENEAILWETATGHRIATLGNHAGPVLGVSFSPDGSVAITLAERDPTARMWSTAAGEPIAEMSGHAGQVRLARFSKDGSRVLTVAIDDRSAHLWNGRTGDGHVRLEDHKGTVEAANFVADAYIVSRATNGKSIFVWRADTGSLVTVLSGHEGVVAEPVVLSNPLRLATKAQREKTIRIWSLKDTNLIRSQHVEWTEQSSSSFLRTKWIKTPSHLIIAPPRIGNIEAKKRRVLWSLALPGLESSLIETGHTANIQKITLSPDNRLAVTTTSSKKEARLWDMQSRTLVKDLEGLTEAGYGAEFSADGESILVKGNSTARLFRTRDGSPILAASAAGEEVISTLFVATGRRLVTWGEKTSIAELWDTATGQRMMEFPNPARTGFSIIQGASKGSWILTRAEGDTTARLWNAETGTQSAELTVMTSDETTVTATRDDQKLLAISKDGTHIQVLDAATGKPLQSLSAPSKRFKEILESVSSARALAVDTDGAIHLFDIAAGKHMGILSGVTGSSMTWDDALSETAINARQVLKDGTGGRALWDLSTGTLVRELEGHTGEISNANVSPDGKRLLTRSSEDNAPRLWDMKTGDPIAVLRGHRGPVTSVVFSEDGRRILTLASNDTDAWLWDAATGAAIAVFPPGTDLSVHRADFGRNSNEVLILSDRTLQSWNVPDVPILSGRALVDAVCRAKFPASDANDRRNPCQRSGPLSPAFYLQPLEDGRRWLLNWFTKPAPEPAEKPGG